MTKSIFIISTIIFSFCTTFSYSQAKKKDWKVGDIEKGEASYYGNKYHGKPTASGELYNKDKFSTAHRTLPFGSLVQVVNLQNGKTVNLKVNDRGPYKETRIIDVSGVAAIYLDMVKAGVLQVEMKVLRVGPGDKGGGIAGGGDSNIFATALESDPNATVVATEKPKDLSKAVKVFKTKTTYDAYGIPQQPKGYGIQIGTFFSQEKAQMIAKEAMKLGLDEVYIQTGWSNGKTAYRLLYGADTNQKKLRKKIPKTISKGFSGGFLRMHF